MTTVLQNPRLNGGIFRSHDLSYLAQQSANDRRGIIIQENLKLQPQPRNRIQININRRKSPESFVLREIINRPNKDLKYSTQNLPQSSVSSRQSQGSPSRSVVDKCEPINNQQNDYCIEDLKNLTEDDIQFLLDNTGFTNEQIIKWHTDFLTKCATGLITSNQFKDYYSFLLPETLVAEARQELLNKLFGLFDIDGDGCLNFTEFLVSFWIRCMAPIREKYTWIFNMLDSDRNGYLSFNEIKEALQLCLDINDLNALRGDLFIDEKSENLNDLLDETVIILFGSLKENQIQPTDFRMHSSVYFLNSATSFYSKSRLQMDRENFLDLCEKYKHFRKLILPINYFYDESLEFF